MPNVDTTALTTQLQLVTQDQPTDGPTEQAAGRSKPGPKVLEDGTVEFWAMGVDTKKTPNRLGFVFKWNSPDDVETEDLRANPVLLWRHDSWDTPIGTILDIEVTKTQVWFRCSIPGGDGYEHLAMVRQMIVDRLLRAVSISFYIREWEQAPDEVENEQGHIIVTKVALVELSVCTIGAHETALISGGKDAGKQAQAELVAAAFQAAKTPADPGAGPCGLGADVPKWNRVTLKEGDSDELVGTVHVMQLDAPAPVDSPEALVGIGTDPERWTAVPFDRHATVATADEPTEQAWSTSTAKAQAKSHLCLRVMALLELQPDPEKPGTYKLLHHAAGPDFPVTWKGVASAMAILLGARGGAQGINAEQRQIAYDHLAGHYRQFEREAPELAELDQQALADLHAAGAVIIPGHDGQAATVAALQAAVDTMAGQTAHDLDAIRSQIADLAASAPNVDELAQRLGLTDAADDAGATLPQTSVGTVDDTTLRQAVRQILQADAGFMAAVGEMADTVVGQRRKANGPRY